MALEYTPREEVTRIGYGCMYCHGDVSLKDFELPPREGYCTGCGRILGESDMYLKTFVPGGCVVGEFPVVSMTITVENPK